jgi:hypothetical protein
MVPVTWERVSAAGSTTDEPLVEHSGEASGGMEEHSASEATSTSAELAFQRAIGAQSTCRPELTPLSSCGLDAVEGERSVKVPLKGGDGYGLLCFPLTAELALATSGLFSQWVLTYHLGLAKCGPHCE